MANKGLQFEDAVMYVAKDRITEARSREDEAEYKRASLKWDAIPSNIKTTAEKIIDGILPRNPVDQQTFYKSLKKMSGGGEEPKTDIKFMIGTKKYKCSMKWGKSFQLTSAGIEKSILVFQRVLQKSLRECSGQEGSREALGYIQSMLEQIADEFENATGTMDQPTAKRKLADTKKTGGLQEQFTNVLGTRKDPQVSDLYTCFKRNLTRECMTGELLFNKDDRAADHLFTENGLKPIDNKAVDEIMSLAGVRLALKGRGKDPSTGIRRNAIVIRYEV